MKLVSGVNERLAPIGWAARISLFDPAAIIALLDTLAGFELVAPDEQSHFFRQAGQEEALRGRAVAAADHCNRQAR